MIDLAEPTPFQDLTQSVFLWRYFQVKVVLRVGGVDLSQSMDVAVSILKSGPFPACLSSTIVRTLSSACPCASRSPRRHAE